MRKIIVLLVAICTLFCVAGCSVPNDTISTSAPTEVVFTLDTYGLQITADNTFHEKTGGSFDLQITNDRTYISIMAYQYIDLPSELAPQDVYDMQNEELFSKRDNVTVIEEPNTQSYPQYTMTKGLFSAEKDGVKNHYISYLIDFPDKECFAWVLVAAMPSYLESNQDYLHNIVRSLAPVA